MRSLSLWILALNAVKTVVVLGAVLAVVMLIPFAYIYFASLPPNEAADLGARIGRIEASALWTAVMVGFGTIGIGMSAQAFRGEPLQLPWRIPAVTAFVASCCAVAAELTGGSALHDATFLLEAGALGGAAIGIPGAIVAVAVRRVRAAMGSN